MRKKLQIFISSTFTDLIEERQAAVSAILKAGHIPAGMELFTSGDESQMATIKRWIDESDIFMLILGGRYGSIEPTTSLSYTELEYDYAISLGKPHFAVVIDEAALEQKVKMQGTVAIESENNKELKIFRQKVLSKMSAFFEDTRDIRLAVHETIGDLLNRHEFKGWVSGAEIPDIQSFTEQINKLREENKQLSEDNKNLREQLSSIPLNPENDTNDEEIVEKLKELKIKVNVKKLIKSEKVKNGYSLNTLKSYLNLPKKTSENAIVNISVFTILKATQSQLITGVYNQADMNPLHYLLFFNVLPKLQIYSLASSERVPGAAFRRFALTEKGIDFLKFIHDNKL
ncbi:MAG: DUF4062 domain-containing protein [Pyrinomonadaceae bacterium]